MGCVPLFHLGLLLSSEAIKPWMLNWVTEAGPKNGPEKRRGSLRFRSAEESSGRAKSTGIASALGPKRIIFSSESLSLDKLSLTSGDACSRKMEEAESAAATRSPFENHVTGGRRLDLRNRVFVCQLTRRSRPGSCRSAWLGTSRGRRARSVSPDLRRTGARRCRPRR